MSKSIPTREQIYTDYLCFVENELCVETFDLCDSSSRSKLEKIFRSESKAAKARFEKIADKSQHFLEEFDFTPAVIKLKKKASLTYAAEAQTRFAENHPTLSPAKMLVELNARENGLTYELFEKSQSLSLAVAIWILDMLAHWGRLEDAIPYLPDESVFTAKDLELFGKIDFTDACYDSRFINSMRYVILHRNDRENMECVSFYASSESLKRAGQAITYVSNIKPDMKRSISPREAFNYIVSLLDSTAIATAVNNYTEDVWRYFDGCLCSFEPPRNAELNILREEASKLERLIRLDKESKSSKAILSHSSGYAAFSKTATYPIEMPSTGRIGLQSDSTESEIHRLEGNMIELIEKWSALQNAYFRIHHVISSPDFIDERQSADRSQYVKDICPSLLDFRVKNPFETCFAFLYLLDSGSYFPWLYSLNYSVLLAAARSLPWTGMRNVYGDDYAIDITDAFFIPSSDYAGELLAETECVELREMRAAIESAVYQPFYTNDCIAGCAEKMLHTIGKKLNLPQIVYEKTGVLIPRDLTTELFMDDLYARSGFAPEETDIVTRYMVLARAVRQRNQYQSTSEKAIQTVIKSESELPPSDREKCLSKKIKELEAELTSLKSERKELKSRLAKVETEKEDISGELAELRTMIRDPAKQNDFGRTKNISFPYAPIHRHVVLGGHDTWVKAIKPLLSDVRFVDRGENPNTSLILHADTVWIQHNALAHKDYYRIMGVARNHNIDVQYFSFASAEKCAAQLAEYDRSIDDNS